MRFTCPSCRSAYNIPDEKLRSIEAPGGIRTRCKACGTLLIIDAKRGHVRKGAPDPGREKAESPLRKDKFRGNLPTVLSMSKGTRREKDIPAVVFVVLLLVAGLWAGYTFFSHARMQVFSGWVRSLSQLKEGIPVPRIFESIVGKPRSKPVDIKTASARRLLRKGYDLYQEGRLKSALQILNAAIQKGPKNPEAHYWKGRTLLKMGRGDEALEAFKKALALRPGYWEALDNIGWIHMRRGEYAQSLSSLNRSIQLKPDNAWAYYNRAFLHAKTGNAEMALKDAEKACQFGNRKGCLMAQKYRGFKKKADASKK